MNDLRGCPISRCQFVGAVLAPPYVDSANQRRVQQAAPLHDDDTLMEPEYDRCPHNCGPRIGLEMIAIHGIVSMSNTKIAGQRDLWDSL